MKCIFKKTISMTLDEYNVFIYELEEIDVQAITPNG